MSGKKIQHAAEEVAGQAKETAGKVTGDENLEARGAAEKDEAKLKQAGDKVAGAVDDVKQAFKK
jgi:uncharacterized protein YjbJ (UPF0337 family)